MSNKETKAIEEKSDVILPPKTEEFKQYRYGDAVITCKCGHDTVIKHPMFTNVQTGVQLPALTTDNRQFLGLACDKCKSSLILRMIEAVHPPAYNFSHEGFDASTKQLITWEAGKDVVSYGVYITEIGNNIEEGKQELILIGSTTKPSFEFELKENTAYRFRVDTVYGQDVYPSDVIFISTEPKPEDNKKVVESIPTIELEKNK